MAPTEDGADLARQGLVFADALYNLARYLTGSATDAEDLVQETFERALRGAEQFTPGTNLKAWLFRILRNAFISHYRHEKKSPMAAGVDLDDAPIAPALLRDDAEIDLLRHVVARDLEAAMMRLSADARAVVLLDLEGLTETEVAGVLGCAVGTVKSRLARARAALRRLLRGYAPDDQTGEPARSAPRSPPESAPRSTPGSAPRSALGSKEKT